MKYIKLYEKYLLSENPPFDIYPRKHNFEEPQNASTKEELENIDWVQTFKDTPGFIGFFYGKLGDGSPDALMLVHEDLDNPGKIKHWVIGYICGPAEKIGLEDYNQHTKR